MIKVTRSEPTPPSLLSATTVARLAQAEAYYAAKQPADPAYPGFVGYREYDVRQALLTMFNRKCAYCEKQVEKGILEVEHYRPKGNVSGCDHDGYWWLAWDWSNLLPTCPGCNKGLKHHIVTADMSVEQVSAMQAVAPQTLHGKAMQFPVGGTRLKAKQCDHFAEKPRLLDPTRSDPEPHLRWRHDSAYSVVEPSKTDGQASPEGEATIACVALNRVDLVESRTQILKRLQVQRIQILDDFERDAKHPELGGVSIVIATRRVADMKAACAPDQPYSAMAKSFVMAFEQELKALAEKVKQRDEAGT